MNKYQMIGLVIAIAVGLLFCVYIFWNKGGSAFMGDKRSKCPIT